MITNKSLRKKLISTIVLFVLIPFFSISIQYGSGVTYEATFEVLAHIESTGGDTFECQVVDDLAYIIDMTGGLLIYNVSDPTSPELCDTFYDGGGPHNFYLDGDLLYLADHYQGLEIYNVSDPRNIIKLGQIADSGDGETHGVFVCDNIAYTAE